MIEDGAQTTSDAPPLRLVFARVRSELRDELQNSGIEGRVGSDRIYLEVDDAVTAEAGDQPQAQEGTETP